MSKDFRAIIQETNNWTGRAEAAGWLTPADLDNFLAIEKATPAELFADKEKRTLVVAFFGGTGVGKSSLLNRLAGETIARVGVERPTSHEITLYLHSSIELADLPPSLPIEKIRVDRHTNNRYRDVLWIDMVDVDSTEISNQQLAFAWLSYIDLLIYVVSPERYRDDTGWQVLQQRGQKHGWIFVINHWDEGDQKQVEDFKTILGEVGFKNPLLFKTCCAPQAPETNDDDFGLLEEAITAAADAQAIRLLEQSGEKARLLEIESVLRKTLRRFGTTETWKHLKGKFHDDVLLAQKTIVDGTMLPVQEIAARLTIGEGKSRPSFIQKSLREFFLPVHDGRTTSPAVTSEKQHGEADRMTSVELTHLCRGIWDEWSQDKLMEPLNMFEMGAGRANVAARPIRAQLEPVLHSAPDKVINIVQDQVRRSMALPGTALRRFFCKLFKIGAMVLPAAVLGWVAFAVVHGYYRALAGQVPFLGIDFAVHSGLFVFLAWLFPFLLSRILRPSRLKAAEQGLTDGLHAGLALLGRECETAFEQVERERNKFLQEADTHFQKTSDMIASARIYDESIFPAQLQIGQDRRQRDAFS